MRQRPVQFGDILEIGFPQHHPHGHEQSGRRPAIVVGLPGQLGKLRFPVLFVVPLSTQIRGWATLTPRIYPIIPAGVGGLSQRSVVLLDQLRSIDETRITGFIGSLGAQYFTPIIQTLRQIF